MRDLQDMTRTVDPLQKVDGVWELDTTGMTQETVVDTIEKELVRRGLL
jgi:cytidylate kinase